MLHNMKKQPKGAAALQNVNGSFKAPDVMCHETFSNLGDVAVIMANITATMRFKRRSSHPCVFSGSDRTSSGIAR
nr:hypothetical protein [Fretibacterium fastidiosum]